MRRGGERRNYVNRLNTWVYIDESKREKQGVSEREREHEKVGRQSGDPVRRGERARGLRVGELLGFAIERETHKREKLVKLKIYAHACPSARSTEGENDGSIESVERESQRGRTWCEKPKRKGQKIGRNFRRPTDLPESFSSLSLTLILSLSFFLSPSFSLVSSL